MSLSERLQSIHFNKGAIGYNTKEVDAFVAELRTAAERDESALRTLRAKLDAFEGRSAEITRTENEAYRLLAAAKDEAEKVRAAAEAQAKTMLEDAKVRAAAAEAVAAERASAAEREAARRANETVGNARQNAAMILAAADKRGREALAAAEREAADVRARTAALFRRSAEFEEKLRRLTADTVRALAALNASAPADATVAPAAAAAPASAPAETLSMPDPTPIFASRPRRTGCALRKVRLPQRRQRPCPHPHRKPMRTIPHTTIPLRAASCSKRTANGRLLRRASSTIRSA